MPFFLKTFAAIGAIENFVGAGARIGGRLGIVLGRMRETRVGLCFNVDGIGACIGRFASTCCSGLMHAHVPPKTGKVGEALATLSATIKGLCVGIGSAMQHRAMGFGFREVRVICNEYRGHGGRGSGGGGRRYY